MYQSNQKVTENFQASDILVRRNRLCDGVYINGIIQGTPVVFTTDTGASRTVISDRIFRQIPYGERPQLVKSSCLKGAGGIPIKESGKAVMQFSLGPLELEREIIVAEIEDDALLGYDILKGDNQSADILLSQNKIILNGTHIPCFQVGRQAMVRQVVSADDYCIPGYSESVISVYIDRTEDDDNGEDTNLLIQGSEFFSDRYQLILASTLVDINSGPTCKVRVLNPFPDDAYLKQDAVLGKAETIDRVVTVLCKEESNEEKANCCSVRRIRLRSTTSIEKSHLPECDEKDIPEYLLPLFKKSVEDMPDNQKRAVAGLLVKYQSTFSQSEFDIGLTNLTEHPIKTGDAPPVKQRPRRIPLAHAEEERKAIEELLQKGVIRKSTSPWASPIVLVRKKSGEIRPCVDYRKVNELVKPDGYPLPRIQDCLDAVADSSLFSSFDLTSGYFQIPLREEDIPKSAFVCKYGQFEMTRMPFGLNNAASTFQRTMELALQGLQWVTCLVYIDDVIVFGKNFREHMQRVDEVLERIKDAGLKLKPSKCSMFQHEVVFLGHVVSKDGVSPDPSNIEKIIQWPRPKNARQVKQFVAMGSYYRRYVKDFARVAKPLNELTKKDKEFKWDTDCEKAFSSLKQALVSKQVMGYPLNEAGTFLLDVDASGLGIGGVLSQVQEGRERVIAFGSRGLSKSEKNYCITEKELLAVLFFVQYYRQYLIGRKFIVRTDHQALVWLFSLKEPSGKIARWIEILALYDFTIEYRPGKKQGHCDALSRCENPRECACLQLDTSEPLKCGPCAKCLRRGREMLQGSDDTSHIISKIESLRSSKDDPSHGKLRKSARQSNWLSEGLSRSISAYQLADPDINTILTGKLCQRKPSTEEFASQSHAARHYYIMWDVLLVKDGTLYKRGHSSNGLPRDDQLIVPFELKERAIFHAHDSVTAGHLGCKRTKAKLSQHYYWYNMREDVSLYVKRCDICARDKKPNKTPRAPMGTITTGAPWDVVAIDFTGPFPVTERGNRYILVLTDHFSKYTEVIAVPNQTAEECASRILSDIISRWGAPLSIHSDQGTTFESKVFKELCKALQIRKTRTSARNPRGNGQVERFNRTLLQMIRAYLSGEQDQWDLHLGCLAGAYRASPHESTSLTPNMMMIGREVRLPADVLFQLPQLPSEQSPCTYVQQLRDRMRAAHEIARKYLAVNTKRSKEIYDAKLSFMKYDVGDIVWCLHENRRVGISPKLEKAYNGPYVVTCKMSELNFVIQLNKDGERRTVHHNKLKPYEGTNTPRWITAITSKLKTSSDV